MRFAICTVAIPRESIFWIEEWVRYHLDLGFEAIYFYDNTGSERYDSKPFDPEISVWLTGKNKRGNDIRALTRQFTDEQIEEHLRRLAERYTNRFHVLRWTPVDDSGRRCQGQTKAYAHFLQMHGREYDWVALNDVDEFVVNEDFATIIAGYHARRYNEIRMHEKLFGSRIRDGAPVASSFSIKDHYPHWDIHHSHKRFVKTTDAIVPEIHSGGRWRTRYRPAKNTPLRFHHYRVNPTDSEFPILRTVMTEDRTLADRSIGFNWTDMVGLPVATNPIG